MTNVVPGAELRRQEKLRPLSGSVVAGPHAGGRLAAQGQLLDAGLWYLGEVPARQFGRSASAQTIPAADKLAPLILTLGPQRRHLGAEIRRDLWGTHD